MSNRIVGVDIGATKTRVGVVQDSQVIREADFPTSSTASKQQILDELSSAIKEVAGNDFYGIGIGVPGLVDETNGIIYDLWNIPSWKEVHLKKDLEAYFKKPVRMTNDANIFVLGESVFGKGAAYRNFIGITLGTGFGTGIVIDGKLYSGTLSSAGELGDIPYLDDNIETYCSGKFFREQHGMSGAEVFRLAEEGDPQALEILREFGKHLGNARTKYEDGARSLDRFQDKLDRAVDLADDDDQAEATQGTVTITAPDGVTPITLGGVPAGTHTLEVTGADFTNSFEVEIEPNVTTTLLDEGESDADAGQVSATSKTTASTRTARPEAWGAAPSWCRSCWSCRNRARPEARVHISRPIGT